MKFIIVMLLLVFGFQFTNAQEFLTDKTYKVVINEVTTDKESSKNVVSIVLTDHPEIVLSSFQIDASPRIQKVHLKNLKQPQLNNVDNIIQVDLFYLEPYAYTISQYILIMNDTESILLPPVVNIESNEHSSETLYVFPSQIFGDINKITKLEIVYKDSFNVDKVKVLQNYAWSDAEN